MICVKRYRMRMFVGVGLMILAGMLSSGLAQKAEQQLPLVVTGNMPLYPLTALHARVQGVVKIKVTTDGKKITSLDAESGPPMLVKFTKENILTWRFAEHKPTTFVTRFECVIEEPSQCDFSNDALVLKLPLEVRISAKGLETCDPAAVEPHGRSRRIGTE
jgi:hypothetical protein